VGRENDPAVTPTMYLPDERDDDKIYVFCDEGWCTLEPGLVLQPGSGSNPFAVTPLWDTT
jgi:hypothetical protein